MCQGFVILRDPRKCARYNFYLTLFTFLVFTYVSSSPDVVSVSVSGIARSLYTWAGRMGELSSYDTRRVNIDIGKQTETGMRQSESGWRRTSGGRGRRRRSSGELWSMTTWRTLERAWTLLTSTSLTDLKMSETPLSEYQRFGDVICQGVIFKSIFSSCGS